MNACCLNLAEWHFKTYSEIWSEFISHLNQSNSGPLADLFGLLPRAPKCCHADGPVATRWVRARDKMLAINCILFLLSKQWLRDSFPDALRGLRRKLPTETAALVWLALRDDMLALGVPTHLNEPAPVMMLGDPLQMCAVETSHRAL
jgi:hypothetical protein